MRERLRRLRTAEFWVDPDAAERYRDRRAKGTRSPLALEHGRGYFAIAMVLGMLVAAAVQLVTASSVLARVGGVALLGVAVACAAGVVSYMRKPVDDEFRRQRRWRSRAR